MHRYLLSILLLATAGVAAAQDSAPEDDEAANRPTEAASRTEADAREDDADLDEESYMEAEEEDFVPSEDIPADQAIPFPTDI